MFSFSMDKNVPLDTGRGQLAHHGIGEDHDLARRLRDRGELRDDRLYYRAENENPRTIQEAVEYVQKIFFHPPEQVWMGGEVIDVTDEHLEGTRKPGA